MTIVSQQNAAKECPAWSAAPRRWVWRGAVLGCLGVWVLVLAWVLAWLF